MERRRRRPRPGGPMAFSSAAGVVVARRSGCPTPSCVQSAMMAGNRTLGAAAASASDICSVGSRRAAACLHKENNRQHDDVARRKERGSTGAMASHRSLTPTNARADTSCGPGAAARSPSQPINATSTRRRSRPRPTRSTRAAASVGALPFATLLLAACATRTAAFLAVPNAPLSPLSTPTLQTPTQLQVRKTRADYTADGAAYDRIATNTIEVLRRTSGKRVGPASAGAPVTSSSTSTASKKRASKKQRSVAAVVRVQPVKVTAGASATAVRSANAAANGTTSTSTTAKRTLKTKTKTKTKSKTAAASSDAPSALTDTFSSKTVNQFDLLGSGLDAPTQVTEHLISENAEAQSRSTLIDQRVADLLSDDSGEIDDDHPDHSPEAAAEVADKRTYWKTNDVAKMKASETLSKSAGKLFASSSPLLADDTTVGGSIRMKGGIKGKPVVGTKKRVTATVQETGRDTIQSYTKSFTNHELLSREAEATLGREVQILVRWEERRGELEMELLRPPTFGEWAQTVGVPVADLKKQIRKSQRAKAALVEANLRLVVTSARALVKKNRAEISFHDACQDGILGLTRACEKFDPAKDFRFSTYALWWIRGEITKGVSRQSSPIALPKSARKKINDIRITERILMSEKGRKPTEEEVAQRTGLTPKQLAFYRRSAREVVSTDQKLTAKMAKGSSASGDAGKKVTEIGDLVKDDGPSPEEMASKQMMREDVRRLVRSLSPREQVVIRMRFGLDDGEPPQTLKAIAKKFGATIDQIRKLEESALGKLRQRTDASLLEDASEDS